MQLSVRRFIADSGERFAVLVDHTGMPLFYPNLFVTAKLRNASLAFNTIAQAFTALKVVLAWERYFALDIESRFKRSELLEAHEIHALRDFMQVPLGVDHDAKSKVSPLRATPKVVSTESQYNRMTIAAGYLEFLAERLHPAGATKLKAIASMTSQIKANRPKVKDKGATDREDKHLEEALLDSLEEVLRPGSPDNPVDDFGLQVRNGLMFMILRLTGIRRGELLNLKIEDFNFAKNTMKIVRRPDSRGDVRVFQPVAKTRQRTFPLHASVMDKIFDYVKDIRSKIPGAQRHGYLFVTHKICQTRGMPLSYSAFGKFFGTLSKCAGGIEGVHAHALRHHWNYIFSKSMDAQGVSPEREIKIRTNLMGWSPTSKTAATYNQRHIKEAAGVAMTAIQTRILERVK